jgi:hypothetical protein
LRSPSPSYASLGLHPLPLAGEDAERSEAGEGCAH